MPYPFQAWTRWFQSDLRSYRHRFYSYLSARASLLLTSSILLLPGSIPNLPGISLVDSSLSLGFVGLSLSSYKPILATLALKAEIHWLKSKYTQHKSYQQ